MSRNKEKAQSLLSQFQQHKALELGYININKLRRPRNVGTVSDLNMAEKWRKVVLSEINKKLIRLYDIVISDNEIRDLNDEVNKLFREKRAWEYRIRELGGPDYLKFDSMNNNTKGEFVTIRNYKYFGRAKELKEVKELMIQKKLEDENNDVNKKKRDVEKFYKRTVFQKLKELDSDYYGMNETYKTMTDKAKEPVKNPAFKKQDDVPENKHLKPTIYKDDMVSAEQILSKDLMQKMQNDYERSQLLKEYKNQNETVYSEDFLNSIAEDLETVESVNDIETFLVNRSKRKMLESLGLS